MLYDSNKRAVYDRFGEQKLKEGIVDEKNEPLTYKFTTDPEEIFEKFFGSKNVYEHLLEVGKG